MPSRIRLARPTCLMVTRDVCCGSEAWAAIVRVSNLIKQIAPGDEVPEHVIGIIEAALRDGGAGSVSFLHPIECVVLSVLHLDPVLRPAALIGSVAMFRDKALKPELAGVCRFCSRLDAVL